jgi:hypothetical protein
MTFAVLYCAVHAVRMCRCALHLQLWMTESFFSQYRGACKVAAYDYCFYASGAPFIFFGSMDAFMHLHVARICSVLSLRTLLNAKPIPWAPPSCLQGSRQKTPM